MFSPLAARYLPAESLTDTAGKGLWVKRNEEIVEILEAYDLTGSYRAAAELVAQRWRATAGEAMDEARRTLTQLRSSEPLGALDKMTRLGDVDPVAAGELLGLIQRLGAELASEGRIPSASVARHLSVELLDDLTSGRMPKLPPSRRFGMGKWEPLLYDVVSATGIPVAAMAVVGGRGAGRLRMIRGLQDLDTFEPREILGSVYPMNNLSPLLWQASAVFTLRGGSGAHAFEVADALGVPAICNAEHNEFDSVPGGTLVALDGDAGVLWLLPEDPSASAAPRSTG